jgi:alpha-tubulin suppressor-like RCC1 family protein
MASDDREAGVGARRRVVASLALVTLGALAPVRALAKNAQVDEDFGDKPRPGGGKDKGGNAIRQELDRYASAKAVNVAEISAGGAHTVVVRRDGIALAWGNNDAGQLGDGSLASKPRPSLVSGGAVWLQIGAGGGFCVGIRRDGSAWVWGQQGVDRDGGAKRGEVRQLQGVTGAVAVAAGGQHALILTGDGQLWGWGGNAFGQIGDGTAQLRNEPVQVAVGIASVAAGARHSLAVRRDGTLLVWGANDLGQLGTGDGQDRKTPASLGAGYAGAAAGRSHSLAIRKDGSLVAFGDNRAGQLGDGSTARRATPVRVGGDADWTAVAAGDAFSLGLRGSKLYAWGANDDGELGLGTTANAATPQAVAGDFVRIAAGSHHSVALRADGTVWAWGASDSGQAGAAHATQPRPVS